MVSKAAPQEAPAPPAPTFEAAKYDAGLDLDVQEEDGTWTAVKLYRHKTENFHPDGRGRRGAVSSSLSSAGSHLRSSGAVAWWRQI